MGMCLIKILHRTVFLQRSVQNSINFFITGHWQVCRPAQNSGPENCTEFQGFDFPDGFYLFLNN